MDELGAAHFNCTEGGRFLHVGMWAPAYRATDTGISRFAWSCERSGLVSGRKGLKRARSKRFGLPG
jgi:hypothetical protein